MRTARVVAFVLAVLTVSLSGCTADHAVDATDLQQELSGMPGVRSVEQDYEAGDQEGVGHLSVRVAMETEATTEETLAVVEAAYDEFATTHRGESSNLSVRRSGTLVLVHTQDPQADLGDVLGVCRYALEAPLPGERMRADLVARNENGNDDLVSELRLSLVRGSTEDDVVPRLDDLASMGDLPQGPDVWVLSADGAGVGGSRGLPTEDDLALWRQLSAVPAPGSIRVEFGPYQLYSDLDDYGFANVSVRATPAPTREQLAAMKSAHLAALARRSHTYVYNVTVNGEDTIWLRRRGS